MIACPTRNLPGYWSIVFKDGSSIRFYVPPKETEHKEHKGISAQAVCGPGLIVLLAVIPLAVTLLIPKKT
ncbi:CGP-CTERM sorting domain-containing protein [Thermococcus sp.]